MVFDIILLGVQNPADTVSAPQSNSFIMLWFPFYFIFMDLFSVSRSTDTQCRGCGVRVRAPPPKRNTLSVRLAHPSVKRRCFASVYRLTWFVVLGFVITFLVYG